MSTSDGDSVMSLEWRRGYLPCRWGPEEPGDVFRLSMGMVTYGMRVYELKISFKILEHSKVH